MPRKKSAKAAGHKKSHKSHQKASSGSHSYGSSRSQQSTFYYIAGAFAFMFLFAAFFIYLPSIRRAFGFADTSVDPAVLRGHRTRLKKLYEKYNPNKLDEIDEILEKYRGREKELFKAMHKKYVKPNRKIRDKGREEERARKRRQRMGLTDDDIIPDDETEEEAAQRRRRKKERDREKRRAERKQERGGKDYDDDEDSSERKKKYSEYFSGDDDDWTVNDKGARDEGEIELMDDDEDED
eukprot:CAMPEP_0197022986 /NCGR_PEP_ID=MMETSP1384-20130603/3778_1 /TAXON_ID=29189 /ORGANISM="Ammonia sp." /LENGTH=238 /DNA_ID=CAMNT_0042451119 /DNA_START=24 /DNA_END=740 /DNA_ORIENTATION=+